MSTNLGAGLYLMEWCLAGASMERLDHKLDCKTCGTIYLDLPEDLRATTSIHCSLCGTFLGHWGELKRDFARQGGADGIFEMKKGQVLRKA